VQYRRKKETMQKYKNMLKFERRKREKKKTKKKR